MFAFIFGRKKSNFNYPSIRRDESVVDDYHGTKVNDPYRWLETEHGSGLKKFILDQNKVSNKYMQDCPIKKQIKEKLIEASNYEKFFCPFRKSGRYFFFRNSGLQNHNILFAQESIAGDAREVLNPNTLSEFGEVSVDQYSVSDNGELLAYALSEQGSDWLTIHFKSITSGEEEFPHENLVRVKFSNLIWSKDSRGIFYSRYPPAPVEPPKKPEEKRRFSLRARKNTVEEVIDDIDSYENHKLYYHLFGTPQTDDNIVVEFINNPKWRIKGLLSCCGKYLIVCPEDGVHSNLLFISKLNEETHYLRTELIPIVTEFQCDYDYVTNDESIFYFRTNKDSPNYCIIAVDINDPNKDNWQTVISQHDKDVISWATCVYHDKLIVCYLRDVSHVLQLRNLKDGILIHEIPLEVGTIADFSGEKHFEDFFFYFTSFLVPGRISYVNFKQPETTFGRLLKDTKVPELDEANFIVTQEFYESKDETLIPMFIVRKRSLEINGDNQCLLYGYGGFGVNETPMFSVFRFAILNYMNGVLAVPNIRGGGEYGERWHNEGRLMNKQNSFDDFAAAAQYLIENNYTNPKKLAIQGGSNGGMLVAVMFNQHPELFACAIAQVGIYDMVRFPKFTIGYAWCSDYGNPDKPEDFENIMKFSPLHNVRKLPADSPAKQYPAILLCTAEHDDRVVPLHSFKFISELQYRLGSDLSQKHPLLLRVEIDTGHGKTRATARRINELTDITCFMSQAFGHKPKKIQK